MMPASSENISEDVGDMSRISELSMPVDNGDKTEDDEKQKIKKKKKKKERKHDVTMGVKKGKHGQSSR